MFKKQFFPESTIKSLATNQTIYDKGLAIFNTNQVRDLKLNESNRSVEFTVYDEQLKCKTYFSFMENGLAQKYSCDCPAFQKQSGACRHVIASMLYLNTINQDSFNVLNTKQIVGTDTPSGKLQVLHKNRQVLTNLFEDAKRNIQLQTTSINKEALQFEFVLNMYEMQSYYEYELYLKVGEEHLYVVKDIVDVIYNLLEGNSYTFGKLLTYTPDEHTILPEDRKLLAYIYEIGKVQQETLNMAYGQYTANTTGSISIPAKHIPELLKRISVVDGGFVRIAPPPKLLSSINQLESPEVVNKGEKIPLTFEITAADDHYILDISEEDKAKKIRLHPDADVVSVDSTFYLLSYSDYQKVSTLVNTMKEMAKQPLQLTEADLTSFYSLILPSLKNLFDYKVDSQIEEKIKKVPLKPEIFIDYDHQKLKIRPVFKYGNTTIYPLEAGSNEIDTEAADSTGMFIRDVYKEQDTLNVLSHYFGRNKVVEGNYILESIDDISIFIYDSLTELSEWLAVYLSKDAQNIIYEHDASPGLSIEMNQTSNLLDIRFEVAEVAENELPRLINQLQKSEDRFFRLDSGKIIDLKNEKFQEFSETVQKMELRDDEIAQETSLSLFRGLTLGENQNVQLGVEFAEFVKDLKEPDNLDFTIPDNLQASLRPYQETGVKWLGMLDYYGLSGVLADDMGLGKTIQAISFILSKNERVNGKYLILSPSSVIYNWEREFEKFAPSINTAIISGSIEEREQQIAHALNNEDIDVLITSYPLIQRDIDYYGDYTFQTIIMDESQNVKNDATKTTKAVRRLKSNTVFALSGTPIENNLNELWSLFSIILPGLFLSKKSFNEMSEERIAEKIKPFILRRMKEDVLEDLPPKTETIEYIELSKEQKLLYQTQLSLIRSDVENLIEDEAFEQNRMRVLAGMTRLRQICCDPRLIDEDFDGGSAKLERLMEYLEEARKNKKRVVLFSQFTSMLSIIRDILDKDGIDYHYLDGSTPKKDRFELTMKFNEGEKDLFLVSLRAGGTGLNLTGGDTVILYDSWWNPAIEDQAADRVHRFGQKKPVQVIRLITQGTIEEGINELQEQKRELIDNVIRTNDDKNIGALTKEDILGLLTNI